MSSLQMKNYLLKNKAKPSPANLLSQTNKVFQFVERGSRFISDWKGQVLKGSMTVEAALLIPIVVFSLLHLSGVMEMLRFQGKLGAALWLTGNQLTLYTDTLSETAEEVPDAGISYVLVHNQVAAFLGKNYIESSPVVNGALGLNYLGSEYVDENECVDIVVTYLVKPSISVLPFGYRLMGSRYYARAWTGYDVTPRKKQEIYVYITSNGEVWHTTPKCTYIYHEVESLPMEQIVGKRNGEGRLYELCELCKDRQQGMAVYITREGERYHYVRNCSAIYKDVHAVVWYSGMPYRACSRCAAQ